ncbi:hypothetical protein BH11PSE3_BH11PSE3_22930 [soil metagenome]
MAINYTVGENWGSGFVGNMTVPGGAQGVQGWTIAFDASFDISNIWGAEIASHVGNHYVIRNVAWNATVPANGQASFGFQASPGSGGTTASGFTLNNMPDTAPPPPPVQPTLSVADASITEGDSGTSQMTFTVKLSQAATGPVTVTYSTADGTATAGSDYTAKTGTLTFAAGETSKTVTVAVTGDTAVEANETFALKLAGASGATITTASATGIIVNDDVAAPPPVPTLSIADTSIAEGNSGTAQMTFTVKLSQAATGPVTVNYSTADGTATAGSDYTAKAGTLTFAAGETSKAVTVAVTGDTAVEANETFALKLAGASGATIATAAATGTIVNDDVAAPPAGGTSLGYHVESNWGSGFTGSMDVGAGGSALNGWTVEFDASFSITSIWNAKIVSHVGNHYVVSNADWNGQVGSGKETAFGFQATPGSGGTAAAAFKINGTAVGGDPAPVLPTLSVADASVSEGNSGTHALAFTVSLSAAAAGPVTVAYATGNGSATAGSDYTAASGTVTFAAGENSKVVTVQVTGDITVEANETLNLTLSSPSGATIADGAAVGTILNDDTAPLPTLSISDASFAEGSAAAPGKGSFTVSLSAGSTTPVTVTYATADGTATAGSDYTAKTGTLTFAPGETSKTIQVTAIGDSTVEANEGFSIALSNASGATIAHGTGAGTITNDDTAPPVLPSVSISDASVIEGNSGTSGGAADGWLSTSGNQIIDSAGHSVQIAGVNWFGFETGLMVPHGLYARGYQDMMHQMDDLGFNTIRLPFSTDMLHSTATSFNIDYSKSPDLQGLTALQIMDKIVDYAEQIGLKVILDHHRSAAGDGASANGLWYDSQHSEQQFTADWQMLAARYADNTAVIGADLHNEPYNGTWGGGGATDWAAAAERAGNAIGTVNPNWLIFVEGVANYQGQNYWWGGNLMGVKDRPIELTVDNKLVYSAHDYPNSVYAQPWFQGSDFAANLPAKFDQMWGYIYKQGIAPVYFGEFGSGLTDPKDAPWLDAITAYLGGDLNNDSRSDIPAGDHGPSWTFWSWNPDSGDTGGILANDWRTVNQNKMAYLTPIEFDFSSDASPSPTPHALFQVTLSAPATQTITVDYHTVAGEAGSADFAGASGTVTFAAGEQTKTISIAVTPDILVEGNEHFSVVLTNVHGATLADDTGIATILDDDVATPPRLSVADATVTEGNSGTHDLAFTVTLSAAATGPVTVAYATSNGTGNGSATAGSDYTAASGTLTFAAGETSKVVHVQVTGDIVSESNEMLTLTLSAPNGATIVDGTASGTITNDDSPPPAPPSGIETHFSLVDSWSSGFNGNVTVHNDGSSTTGWQIVVDMPNQITDIWNAQIVSHVGTTYVIGPTTWNGSLAHDGEATFGFVASGGYNASALQLHGLGEANVPGAAPTVPAHLAATTVSANSTLLHWDASTVPGGGFVTGYDIFVDGTHVGTTTNTSYRVTGLAADTDYHFSVSASDAFGSSDPANPIAVHTTLPNPNGADAHMFSPYIDMAMSQDADLLAISQASGIQNFTLAFVLSSPQGIGWQGSGTIDHDSLYDGSTILQHVQDIQAAGGNITISFGGAAGTEAALAASSAAQLQAQYQSVIDRYHVTSIDFDIEGAAVADQHSLGLRDQAIVGLQAANPDLKVSFTLPVLPTGLTADGLNVLQKAMTDGVHIDMVNIMAMDYGQSVDNNGQMGLNAIQASEATQQQLATLGIHVKIGITPMIGVNDITSEVFTLADAQQLVDYAAHDPDVAMLSMWSVARDNGGTAGAHYASPDSSGIAQNPFDFAAVFHHYEVLGGGGGWLVDRRATRFTGDRPLLAECLFSDRLSADRLLVRPSTCRPSSAGKRPRPARPTARASTETRRRRRRACRSCSSRYWERRSPSARRRSTAERRPG